MGKSAKLMTKTIANCSTNYLFYGRGSENNQSWPCATEQPHLSALISLHVSTPSHTYIIEQFSLDCTSHVCSSVVFLNNDDSTVTRKNQGTENAKFFGGKPFLYCRQGAGNLTSRIGRDHIRISFKK